MAKFRNSSKIGMIVGGCVASQAIDRSGEVLDVEGADISLWEEGKMVFNFDHFNEKKDKDALPTGNDIVGKVVYAKKVLKESDCENSTQRRIWNQTKTPFIWAIGRLFNGSGHPGAQALAAIIRDNYAHGEESLINFSVEGATLERKDNVLKKTFIRKVALTHKECNAACKLELIFDPDANEGNEFGSEESKDLLKEVANSLTKSMDIEDEEYEQLSKKEREVAKNAIKALVVKKILQDPSDLTVFQKLLPLYSANGKMVPVSSVDDTALNFIHKVKNAPLTINFSPVKLPEFVRYGRFKNQFETSHSFDRLDRAERMKFEAQTFGIPLNVPYRQRPVYGALHLGANEPDRDYEGGAPMFGTAYLVLRPEVKRRATFTHNDSFVVSPQDVMPAQYLDKVALKYISDPDKSDFIEAQVYGGVDFAKDVESLNVPNDPNIQYWAQEFGKKFNVPVYAYDDAGQKLSLSGPLIKTYDAGMPTGAPSTRTGGAALQVEDLGVKKKKKERIFSLIYKAFEKSGLEKAKENFKKFVQENLPEIDDEYFDFFDEAADDLDISKKTLRKMETLSIELIKAIHQFEEEKPKDSLPINSNTINFNGKSITPGKATVQGNLHYLVDETPDHFIGVPHDKDLSQDNLVKLPKSEAGKGFQLYSTLTHSEAPHVLDSGVHGMFPFNQTAEQHALVDGLELAKKRSEPEHYKQGMTKDVQWIEHPVQGQVFVKGDDPDLHYEDGFKTPHREMAYHNIANGFFGLGDHLPKMAAFQHPETGKMYTVQKGIPDAYHRSSLPDRFSDTIKNHANNGQLDKILFMDHVLGNVDRGQNNYLHDKNGKLWMIDHGYAFHSPNGALSDLAKQADLAYPNYVHYPPRPEVQKWVANLNRNDLFKQLVYNKIPKNKILEAMERFDLAKSRLERNVGGRVY